MGYDSGKSSSLSLGLFVELRKVTGEMSYKLKNPGLPDDNSKTTEFPLQYFVGAGVGKKTQNFNLEMSYERYVSSKSMDSAKGETFTPSRLSLIFEFRIKKLALGIKSSLSQGGYSELKDLLLNTIMYTTNVKKQN